MHSSHLLHDLAVLSILLIFAKVLGGWSSRRGIPAVLAELLTGVAAGNLGVALFQNLGQSTLVKELAEMGVLFLLFLVGLETDIKEMRRVGKDAFNAAILGVAAPFALAFVFIPIVTNDDSFNHTLFMAATLTATSVGITARVLQDLSSLRSISGRIILGAAVIDDVLGIMVLTIVAALVTSGSISALTLSMLIGKMLLFALGVFIFRKYLLTGILGIFQYFETPGKITTILFALTMLTAFGAEAAGLAGIIGAFSLGLILDPVHFSKFKGIPKFSDPEHSSIGHGLESLVKPVGDLLIPIFFIYTGMGVKLSAMANAEAIKLALVLIVLGIIGKLACGLALSKSTISQGGDRLLVGVGMIPRGEVGLIFAAMGYDKLKLLNDADYAAVVAMVTVTTLVAPGLIAWRIRRIKAK